MSLLLPLFLLITFLSLNTVQGFGFTGHSAVAEVAQSVLTPAAQLIVNQLIPEVNGQLSAIASWPDEIRPIAAYEWVKPLHYVDTPPWVCHYNRSRDCFDPVFGWNYCIDTAIHNYSSRVIDINLSHEQRAQALKFLVHFIGDIHQPLHCGFTSNYGGNTITGTYNGLQTNLHSIWDSGMIYSRLKANFNSTARAYFQYLIASTRSIGYNYVQNWLNCPSEAGSLICSQSWAEEAISYACTYSYMSTDGKTPLASGFNLGSDYYNRNYPILEGRIIIGGVRLGALLNKLFADAETIIPKVGVSRAHSAFGRDILFRAIIAATSVTLVLITQF
jgi:hypothetical protein